MKRKMKSFFTLTLLFAGIFSFAQQRIVSESVLPEAARTFIRASFPDTQILHIMEDVESSVKDYEVYLVNGFIIEFDKEGNWVELDSMDKVNLPERLLPASIFSYVTEKYPKEFITEIKNKKDKYEVELSNELDLEFDKNGKFKRVDD